MLLSACQVKIPFLKDSKYSMRAPASVASDNRFVMSGEYSVRELELALNFCQDLRALRFSWPFLKTIEKQKNFDQRHYGCNGSYQEKINFESSYENQDLFFPELLTDEKGLIAPFCSRLFHGNEPVEDTEMLSNGWLIQQHFYITSDKKRAFSIIRSEPDGKGQFAIREREVLILSDSRDPKYRGLVVKHIKDKICAKDQKQEIERFEQIMHE